jgi:filamentous hemagglutinin
METRDHAQTASFGNSRKARAFRQRQKELIDQGRLREAIQMDIDDIRSLFGNKYDEAIRQMLEAFGF